MCYWPLVFKKGGLKFWLAFTEKFGSAFSVGKLPRSATDASPASNGGRGLKPATVDGHGTVGCASLWPPVRTCRISAGFKMLTDLAQKA
jgi:hypothetical protein